VQGLLTEYFNELQSEQPRAMAVTGPALGPVPPEYWQELQNNGNDLLGSP